jgi:hypothetical protein
MHFLWIYLLYSGLVLIIYYKFKEIRYRLLLGYFLGLILGGILIFYIDLEIALAIAIFVGLAVTAKMTILKTTFNIYLFDILS